MTIGKMLRDKNLLMGISIGRLGWDIVVNEAPPGLHLELSDWEEVVERIHYPLPPTPTPSDVFATHIEAVSAGEAWATSPR